MRVIAVLGLLAVALTGCAQAESTGADTAPASENEQACADFAASTFKLADALNEQFPEEPWNAMKEEFDRTALSATGDVKSRIEKLVNSWPSVPAVIIYDGKSDMNDAIKAVDRACDAAGSSVDVGLFAD